MRSLPRRVLLELLGLLLRMGLPRSNTAGSIQRLLVIKPDHAGDMLLLTPALRRLRELLADTHVTVLAGPWAAGLLDGSRFVDQVQTCRFPGFTRQPKQSLFAPYWTLLRMALLVRQGQYDAALIARDDHWWGALLAACAGIPHRIGYAAPLVKPFLTTALAYDPGMHVTAQSLALVDTLQRQIGSPVLGAARSGASLRPPDAPPTDLPLGEEVSGWARSRLQSALPGHGLVAIHPGAGGAAKLWPIARWCAVGRALEARGWQVVVTGGPTEVEMVNVLASSLQWPLVVTDAPSLQHLGAIFARCALVLGVDSGPLHVAVAVGLPTVALFGPGDPRRFGPWGDPARQHIVRSGLWCSPCGVLDRCPRGTTPSECMVTIGVQDVLAVVDGLLPERPTNASLGK